MTIPQPTKPQPTEISKCCKGPVRLDEGEEGTNFYWCETCGFACDLAPQTPPVNSREDTTSPLADTAGGEGTREALRLAKEVAASCEKQPSPLGALAQIMKHPIEVKDVAAPTPPSKLSEETVGGGIESLPVYYRSKFSRDCSRQESEEEKSTEMVELSQVKQILQNANLPTPPSKQSEEGTDCTPIEELVDALEQIQEALLIQGYDQHPPIEAKHKLLIRSLINKYSNG